MVARYAVRLFARAADFLAETESWLLSKEDENNGVLSVAKALTTNDPPFREPIYLASVEEAGKVIGCAIAATPDGLEITDLPARVAPLLVASAARQRPGLPWVGGPRRAALDFAGAWARELGGAWQLRNDWMEYRLDEVVPPRAAPGRLRLAESSDWPELRVWALDYNEATNAAVDVAGFLDQRLRRRELFVWDHDGPKGCVAVSGRTPNARRISAVYTPGPFRGRGFASNAVAAASRHALASGAKFCVLFAEREPSQPARIYRAVGYRPIRDHLVIDLSR